MNYRILHSQSITGLEKELDKPMNTKFGTLLILFVFTSCITHRCYLGLYSTEKLIKLDDDSLNRIITSDTLYLNNDIYLNRAVFNCSENRTRAMKVIGNLRDSTVLLVPYESDYRNDTLLFVNTQFFISPLERGLIVSTKKDGSEKHYEYPEDEELYLKTKELEKEGLYKLEKGKFVFLTASMSQDAFKSYCTNATCYIPSPGILYDQKINLNKLKSIDSLEYGIESWLDNF
ncbi:hypothetical protein [uncultured Aquimarina sp.]|uniref:hypothetical protein n=1 Tax=uncultured Aquimarina sp. TaxID=575652 RepID=UPI00261DC046|nr:hypothetical protein [uncultured Aquimarina sp.]